MKGLIIKDFKMMKHESIIGFIVPILFFIISLYSHGTIYFACFSVMMFTLLPTLNIANDEKWKWDKYETVLPIKKEHIVIEKYIMLFLFAIPTIIIESVSIYFAKGLNCNELLNLVSAMFMFGLLSPIIVLPIYFLFGYNIARIAGVPAGMIIYGIFTSIIMVRTNSDDIIRTEILPHINALILFVTGIVSVIISIIISTIVYKRKEF